MLHYSKAYAGQRVGMTLHGVEADKFGSRTWKGVDKMISMIRSLALFTAAAPYFQYIDIVRNIGRILLKAISRNDRLQTSRADLYFDEENKKILQSGRYLIWEQTLGAGSATLMKDYKLTGPGDIEPNRLVSIKGGSLFRVTPYFVIQIDRKPRKLYEDFEIGAASAKLLEDWGDQPRGAAIFDSIQKISERINDAKQLGEIDDLIRDLKKAKTDEKKQRIKESVKAHIELFTRNNSALMCELLANYV